MENKVKQVNPFGLDAEIAATREANYDYEAEELAEGWITDITGIKRDPDVAFGAWLLDGTVLCSLVNTVKYASPDTEASKLLITIDNIKYIDKVKLSAKRKANAMDNISRFIHAVRTAGVPEYSNFATESLLGLKDIGQVVKCIHAYSTRLKQLDLFSGPFIDSRRKVGVEENYSDDEADSLDEELN